MKRFEVRFWTVLAIIFAVLAVACLSWRAIYFGAVFFGALAIGCTGQRFAVSMQDKHKAFKITAICGRVIFALFLVSFVFIQWLIISGERTDNEVYSAERVLVLGSLIYEDRPSEVLQSRLDTAINLLDKNKNAVLVLCGGQGSNEVMPEAEMMKKYLLSKGVPQDKIFTEDKSTNTIQNIENAKQLYNLENYKTAVITSEFHLERARRLMMQAGLDGYGMPAPTPYFTLRAVSHLREYCSTLGLIVSGRYFGNT